MFWSWWTFGNVFFVKVFNSKGCLFSSSVCDPVREKPWDGGPPIRACTLGLFFSSSFGSGDSSVIGCLYTRDDGRFFARENLTVDPNSFAWRAAHVLKHMWTNRYCFPVAGNTIARCCSSSHANAYGDSCPRDCFQKGYCSFSYSLWADSEARRRLPSENRREENADSACYLRYESHTKVSMFRWGWFWSRHATDFLHRGSYLRCTESLSTHANNRTRCLSLFLNTYPLYESRESKYYRHRVRRLCCTYYCERNVCLGPMTTPRDIYSSWLSKHSYGGTYFAFPVAIPLLENLTQFLRWWKKQIWW